MKLRMLLVAAFFLSVARLAAAAPEEEVRAADARRIAGLLRADRAALERVLADDLSYGHSDGRRQTKTELLAALAGGAVVYESYDAPAPTVTVEGAAAWLSGSAELVASARGQRVRMRLRYLAVYRKHGDDWRLAAYQSTPIPPPPAPPR